jgi:uncharacterized membrane protein (DUF2068 family)
MKREHTKSASSPTRRNSDRDGIIVAIAVFKLLKAAALIAAAIGLIEALKGRIDLTRFTAALTPTRIRLASIASFSYAALFLTEGTGLLMRKRWAEWLTIIATASLIPFEIYAIVKEATTFRIGTLIVNVAVVGYLICVRERTARARRPGTSARHQSAGNRP